MADVVDEAQRLEERQRREAIARFGERAIRSARIECVDCGELIPKERRDAAPACRRCWDCQTARENSHGR